MAGSYTWITIMATIVGAVTMDTMTKHRTGCCYSEQYEGKMYITKADYDQVKNVASLTKTEATLHLDQPKQMLVLDADSLTEPGHVVRTYRLIEDYSKHQGWYIQGKSCYKIPLPVSPANLPAPCIPDGSVLVGQYNLGTDEAVQTWTLPNTNISALQRLTVAVSGCVPIQSTSVEFGKRTFDDDSYSNLTNRCVSVTRAFTWRNWPVDVLKALNKAS